MNNWLRKISQATLSANFTIQTQKIGPVTVSVETPFGECHKWYEYKRSPLRWNERDAIDDEDRMEIMNRAIEMEPNCILRISHQFSDYMPEVKAPERTPYEQEYEMDAFDMVNDNMVNLENDKFEQVVKIRDVGETVRAWLFKPFEGHKGNLDSRRVYQNEYENVKFQLSIELFGFMEELFQQYLRIAE